MSELEAQRLIDEREAQKQLAELPLIQMPIIQPAIPVCEKLFFMIIVSTFFLLIIRLSVPLLSHLVLQFLPINFKYHLHLLHSY